MHFCLKFAGNLEALPSGGSKEGVSFSGWNFTTNFTHSGEPATDGHVETIKVLKRELIDFDWINL